MRLLLEVAIDVDDAKVKLYLAQSMSPVDARCQAAQDELGHTGAVVVKELSHAK